MQFPKALEVYEEKDSVQPPEGPVHIWKFSHKDGESHGWTVRSMCALIARISRRH